MKRDTVQVGTLAPVGGMQQQVPVPEDKVLLASFPKSGSNWVRYCLEHFSGLRTPGSVRQLLVMDGPTVIDRRHFLRKGDREYFKANIVRTKPKIDRASPSILRSPAWFRSLRRVDKVQRIVRERRVLLILRSPFALYRRVGAVSPAAMRGYLGNIDVFDHCQRDKLLVYYEDLIRDFSEMERILKFVGIPYDLADFNIAEHRLRSLQLYAQAHDKPATAHDPLDMTFHSRGLDQDTHRALRAFCRDILGDDATYRRYLGRYDVEPGAERE